MEVFKTLPQVARFNALEHGNRTAFVFNDTPVTFYQFNKNADRVAAGLLSLEGKAGDRVAFLGKDSIAAYEILMGSTKAKMVFVPVNWRLKASEVAYIVSDAQVRILFIEQEFAAVLDTIIPELSALHTVIVLDSATPHATDYNTWRDQQFGEDAGLNYCSSDIVLQIYTSGTTGHPKGVQLAHQTFFSMLQGAYAVGDTWMELNENDTLLLAVPIFHIGGIWWNLQSFIAGAKGIIMDSFISWKVLENIERYRITKMAMVPAMIQFLLSEPDINTTDFSSLQYILYGGSPIAPTLRKQAKEKMGCKFFQIYGMTETGNCAVTLRPDEHDDTKRKNAAGRPFYGVEVKIRDANNRELSTGQSGEIWIKSPSSMVGYWNNDTATAQTLQDGWIRTGDGGYIDDQGFIYVCDRIKDMIIAAGENVFPAEIESVISEHPAVKEVAVIGIPDELWGEAVKAYVVLQKGCTASARELALFTRQRIADYKVPKSISFVESVPRNAAGKTLKTELRKIYWAGRERVVN